MTTDDRVIVGLNTPDDAAVVRLDSGRLLVQTVDFFTPIVDDPYLFGQIAAANSLSDIYAMGATPIFALNIMGFPVNDLPLDYMTKILQGGADKAKEAGISIVGGHSIDDKEPKYGLVVTGEVEPDSLVTIDNAKPGDVLILTKPLGTGVLSTALKKDRVSESDMSDAQKSMLTLNKAGAGLMNKLGIRAATDVTGFGLLGHLHEMCHASNVSATINVSKIPSFPLVTDLIKDKIVPGGTKRNLEFFKPHIIFDDLISDESKYLLADPQTSGGLLLACSPEIAEKFIDLFNAGTDLMAVEIGRFINSGRFDITVLP